MDLTRLSDLRVEIARVSSEVYHPCSGCLHNTTGSREPGRAQIPQLRTNSTEAPRRRPNSTDTLPNYQTSEASTANEAPTPTGAPVPTEAPPPYLLYVDEINDTGPHKATICTGFPTREIEWLRHVADGRARNFCYVCSGRESSEGLNSIKSRMINHHLVNRALQKLKTKERMYRIDSASFIKERHLQAALDAGQWCPRRSNILVQKGTTFHEDCSPLFYHHSITAKAVNGSFILKMQSYRSLADGMPSIQELSSSLPTCSHSSGSMLLAEQFKDARERFLDRKERVATLVFKCKSCDMEYITMVVPRAPCHVSDRSSVPRRKKYEEHSSPSSPQGAPFGVNYRSDWVLVFCRWKRAGHCHPSKPTRYLGVPKGRLNGSDAMVRQGPSEHMHTPDGWNDSGRCALSAFFDGQDIWPYSHARPKLMRVGDGVETLEDVLTGAPLVYSDGWRPRVVDLAS